MPGPLSSHRRMPKAPPIVIGPQGQSGAVSLLDEGHQ